MPLITGQSTYGTGDIMIVDDNPANLKLLENMLLQKGHEVRSFPLGRLALAAVINNPPDLILLDINMPEMNGYEVCERLKSTELGSGIPVIFLSALGETEDKIKAFCSGAVDYISKPFQLEEVHARVETHLNLHALQRALKLHNEQLEDAVAARTQELAEANRRLTILDQSKNDFLNLISHELRTPLNGLLGFGELLLEKVSSTEENDVLKDAFQRSRRRLLSLLDDALLLTQIEVKGDQSKSSAISLSAVLSAAITKTVALARSCGVALIPPSVQRDFVRGDEYLLIRAFHALLETAVKFSERGETVQLFCDDVPDWRRVIIESGGKAIPASALTNFFELFSIGEEMTPAGDLGLRPPLASRILSLFGASVSVENRASSGIRLTILLKEAALTRANSGTL